MPGVVACLTAADVPGANACFGIPLLADSLVEHMGQLVALVAATSQTAAERAARRVVVHYTPPPGGRVPIITIQQAVEAGSFYDLGAAGGSTVLYKAEAVRRGAAAGSAMVAASAASAAAGAAPLGSVDATILGTCGRSSSGGGGRAPTQAQAALLGAAAPPAPAAATATATAPPADVATVTVDGLIAAAPRHLSGRYQLPAQQHMYLEPQSALAEPGEGGALRVWSATQSMDAVQGGVSGVLGLPFHKVAVTTKRLGGGFGGKASRSVPVAAAASLAAYRLGRPVAYCLTHNEDLAVNAGRCAGEVTYEAGFDADGKVAAIKAQVVLRAGAFLDLAANDAAALLAASDSAFDLAGLAVEVKLARCNLPPHTIMRGPGYLQGVMVMEQILEHVAADLGKDPAEVKAINFLPEPAGSSSSSGSSGSSINGCSGSGSSNDGRDSSTRSQAPPVAVRPCAGAVGRLAQKLQQQQLASEAASSEADACSTTAHDAAGPPPSNDGSGGSDGDDGSRGISSGSSSSSSSSDGSSGSGSGSGSSSSSGCGVRPEGVTTTFGRFISAASYTLPRVWRELLDAADYEGRRAAVAAHNAAHAWSKRGLAVTPVRFDCSPAAVSASLCVYADGSVLVSHGGIEMGQGLATKVKQAAVAALSRLLPAHQRPLPLHLVALAPSSSMQNPNAGPTWSSTGSEGNVAAVMDAAAQVVARLAPGLKVCEDGLATWRATVAAQFPEVGFAPAAAMLCAYGWFDGTIPTANSPTHSPSSVDGISAGSGCTVDGNSTTITTTTTTTTTTISSSSSGGSSSSGKRLHKALQQQQQQQHQPVQYSAFGAALSEVELDVLTGERRLLATHIVYDCGCALNPRIDLGQVEGGFVMGLGAMLSEEVVVDATGALRSDSTWTYKIPTPDLIPHTFSISFLAHAPNPVGIAGSKASGEPALMTSTSALLALQRAAGAAAGEVQRWGQQGGAAGGGGCSQWRVVTAPATPQKLKGAVGPFSITDALEAAL